MTQSALGTWRQPPLVYVVAELVISPYYTLDDKVPGLQDHLRRSYPRTLEATELVVDGAKPGPQPLWQLLSADQQLGVQLGTRALALHATRYVDSSDFLSRWGEVLQAIQAADLGAFVVRAGLRYVDLIVPSEGGMPADYLVSGLRGIVPEGASCTGAMWAAVFQIEDCTVNLRAGAPSPQGMLLPPAFNALPLAKPAVMAQAEARLNAGQPIGFLDTDCIRNINQVFDADQLLSHYEHMQQLASTTFKAAMSSRAQEEWM